MWESNRGWVIHKLDRSQDTWVNTGVLVDSRSNTLSDTLWDGSHLYIASHIVTVSNDTSPVASVSGQPAKLYRYSYSGGTYTLDAGFPTTITNNSSESMTIDEDTTGAIWATWTQVSGNSTTGFTNTVYVNQSAPGGISWAAPFILPVADPNPSPDDLSAVVAFKNKIGVMWSDQSDGSVYWATRTDGTTPTSPSSWNFKPAIQGKGQADDHLNLKTLQSDNAGRVYAAVKTGLNDTSTDKTLPQLLLLVFKPGTGAFTQSTISTTGDCVSRPQVVLDSHNSAVHVFQTAPSTSVTGCAYSGVAGSIYRKTASMDNPVFGQGRGTPVIQSSASPNMNNVTTSKQSVNSQTGLVVLASDNVNKRYWYSDEPIGTAQAPPAASFTATPTSGTAPLPVTFTNTSTGAPTSYEWTFGDGTTSTSQNPSHTYTDAGTYTVQMTASNSAGMTSSTSTVTVSPGAPQTGVTVGNSTTSYQAASTNVTLSPPAGTKAGDVLVATITADLAPSMASIPTGWTPLVEGLSINSSSTSGARVFAYYRVVGSSEPTSHIWAMDKAAKWGAGVTAYGGVDNAEPLDSSAVTAVDASYAATSISVPSITTASSGAMLIGGIGFDSGTPGATPPNGWIERWESAGGQIAVLADRPQAEAGVSGTTTWTLSSARAVGAWQAALRPAS
ncbi:PKD domain-containing protein [Arthrobacter sp. VKM Ac-2550]|nr:PKD domain-containing protein [Arthrobacter sp. VKM Ac-2550]